MSFFGKNIKKIRGVKGLSQQAFAELFALKRATLGAYEEGRSEPKIETIIKIANYFSISIDKMLTCELTVNELLRFKENLAVEPTVVYKEVFAKVPCITDAFKKDYVSLYNKENFIADLPFLSLPIDIDKNFRAYTVTNLEMTNHNKGLYPKDVVVGERLLIEEVQKVADGTLVLILIDDELVLRRLYINDDQLVLRAEHSNIEDKRYNIDRLKEVWVIKHVFLKRLPDFNDLLEEKLMFLEREFVKLKKNL